jgi:hypothetical protein
MINKNEYREAREQFEKDFALRAFHIRYQIEQEDKNFVFLGSTAARVIFTDQLKASHEAKIAELLKVSRLELELTYFGPEGRPVEENTQVKETPVIPITARQERKPGFWRKMQTVYMSIFW